MKNIIFATNRSKGFNYFDEIIGEMPYKNVRVVHKNLNDAFAELADGTTYEVKGASDNSRGCKCDRAYIDQNVNSDIVNNIIRPCLCMSSLPQDEQIKYY